MLHININNKDDLDCNCGNANNGLDKQDSDVQLVINYQWAWLSIIMFYEKELSECLED